MSVLGWTRSHRNIPAGARARASSARPRLPAAVRGLSTGGLRTLRRSMLRSLVRTGLLRDDAEDAIQDAFVRLFLAEHEQHIRNPAAFLIAIVKRVRIDRWRCAQRRRRRFAAQPAEDFEFPDPAPRPPDYAEADQRLERMWHRVEQLGPRTRKIFILHRLEGRTHAEIAAQHGISISAVEKHIARAA
ncbi:MAG: RNA polymerase sigma factor, partial [Chloroflexota bacterium]